MMTAEQLKASILEMAMQGKLVEQRPEEGTGEDLYKEIQIEKKKLLKEGKIKKQKPLPEITEEELPFDIPESWRWVKLGDISSYAQPKEKVSPKDITPEMWSLDLEDIEKGTGKVLNHVLANERKIQGDKVRFKRGNILYSKLRPYLLKILIADNEGITTPELVPFNVYGIKNSNFFLWYLRSPYVDNAVNSVSYGVKMPRVGTDTMVNLLVPLPPLAEQKRIVAKIEELMPFVDQYAVASTKLNTLNAMFPDMMKKSILQEAVQGKLVPQDPNDEPASVLLKKIAEEKKRLIKEGKIKKGKYDYCIEHRKEGSFCVTQKGMTLIDEMIFDIPDNWIFCTLSELVQFIGGYAYKSNLFVKDSPYQVLRLGNVKNDSLKLDVNPVYITEKLAEETQDFLVRHNDILLTMTGTRLKRDYFYTVCVDNSINSLFVNQRVGCLRPYCSEMSKWLSYVLKSNYVLDFIFNYETGTANQGNLGAENIMKIIIPLPPINEQKRIVKMLDELTAINRNLPA